MTGAAAIGKMSKIDERSAFTIRPREGSRQLEHPAVLVIGHAAAAGEAPANTLAGARACLAAGAGAMEIDVRLSADGVPVLLHDETLDRTTNLRGPARMFTAAALVAADAGGGEHVPTLDEVLDLVAGRLTVMCELKSTPNLPEQDVQLTDAVLAVIERHGAASWTAIHSFEPEIVARARLQQPGISAALISPGVRGDGVERLLSGAIRRHAQAVSVEHSCIDAPLMRRARQRQMTVWAWTADREEDWERLVKVGVPGIITNYPHRLSDYLAGERDPIRQR